MSAESGPLEGMTVVDLSQQLPGPYCTLLLAGLGARVTKVEPPDGDTARHIDPAMFAMANQGKTSIRLDLKHPRDQERLHQLVSEADVFVEGFRPGVTDRLGCDYQRLSTLNPGLVYCSISGFGQTGPSASRPTHDLSLQAIAGALPPDAAVQTVGVPWVDLGVATTAAFLITAHWRTGQGVHLDLAMLDIASAWARIKPSAVGRKEPTYGTFTSSDGATFALALLEDGMWQRLCRALDIEEWSARERLDGYAARVAGQALVRQRIQDELGRRTREHIADLVRTFDLPLDEVRDLDAADEFEQTAWRRGLSRHDGLLAFGPGVGTALGPLETQ
jgi:crotonobetainyl-CoA:carnitine CoA-transferase CaiB-like acyl-CoA transferase